MLEATFLHLPGLTPEQERKLWDAGIVTWSDFLLSLQHRRLPIPVRHEWIAFLRQSQNELARQNISFFARTLRPSEHWRLYGTFQSQTLFLDIETTGLEERDYVTVIGCLLGGLYRSFVRGRNLDEAPSFLRTASLMVTFNGTGFDIPFLQKDFPSLLLPPVHLDVRDLLARLGLRGSQKAIERMIGIVRKESVRGLTGADAVVLWEAHLRGDLSALPKLEEYNREDVFSLKKLMDYAYQKLKERLGW
ncbi:MAG: ribonuclease H-like domain-containing protein [Armatimonadetes bacterium]|nr:ribonuclease H-like domain-containing protein [Armatimonadota bacterium]MDW8122899.1 ribonuclease H-like domain-containing protein [Armatimonadota bacterium]